LEHHQDNGHSTNQGCSSSAFCTAAQDAAGEGSSTTNRNPQQANSRQAGSQNQQKASPQANRFKQEFKIKREPSPSPPPEEYPEIHYLTGIYDISCPQLEYQHPETTGTLRISIYVDEVARKVWGGFELGPKSGIVLIAAYHDDPIDLRLTFGWRARDLDRGGLSFGRGCHGEIEFDGGKTIVGTFFNLFPEPVDFRAKRRMGPLWCGRSAWQFEQQWDGFVTEAYGR
jgi:hypothetical protein